MKLDVSWVIIILIIRRGQCLCSFLLFFPSFLGILFCLFTVPWIFTHPSLPFGVFRISGHSFANFWPNWKIILITFIWISISLRLVILFFCILSFWLDHLSDYHFRDIIESHWFYLNLFTLLSSPVFINWLWLVWRLRRDIAIQQFVFDFLNYGMVLHRELFRIFSYVSPFRAFQKKYKYSSNRPYPWA